MTAAEIALFYRYSSIACARTCVRGSFLAGEVAQELERLPGHKMERGELAFERERARRESGWGEDTHAPTYTEGSVSHLQQQAEGGKESEAA